MSTDLTENSILERLELLPFKVWDSTLPEDESVELSANGLFIPYGAIFFGQYYESAADRGLCAPGNNTMSSYINIVTIAPTPGAARKMKAEVIKLLCPKDGSWKPFDSSFLAPSGGGTSSSSDTEILPTKYMSFTGFTFKTNLGAD